MAAALERPSLTALGQPGASRDKLARIPVRVRLRPVRRCRSRRGCARGR